MAKSDDLDDVATFDIYGAGDDLPTQKGTVDNKFEEENSKRKLAVADIADRIAGKNNEEENEGISPTKAAILGVLAGAVCFAIIVVIDVFLSI